MRLLKSVFILFFTVCSVAYAQMGIHTNGTWEFVGLDSLVIFHLDVEGDTIYAGTWDRNNNFNSGLYYSSDGGSNWTQIDSMLGEGAILGLERNIGNNLYIIKCPCGSGNAGTLYKTSNNGQSWESINNISNNRIRWMRISPFNNSEMYAIDAIGVPGGLLSNLYKSTDGGINWEILGPFPGSSHGSELAFSFDMMDSTSLYVSVDTHFTDWYLFKSTDKGGNWFYISTPPIIPKEIYTDHFIPNRIYLTPKPYVSNNGGLSWFEADSGFTENKFYISFHQDKLPTRLLYMLHTDGLYASGNDNFYWDRLEGSENLPLDLPTEIRNLKNIIIDETSRKIYLGTSNGIYRKSLVTNLQNEGNLQIKGFNLEQNFPNPFNPKTIISYQLPKNAYVTLKVYDLLGNELASLVNEEKPAGSYEVEFQSAIGGWQLTSGMYFYQLKVGNYVETKKMILIK